MPLKDLKGFKALIILKAPITKNIPLKANLQGDVSLSEFHLICYAKGDTSSSRLPGMYADEHTYYHLFQHAERHS